MTEVQETSGFWLNLKQIIFSYLDAAERNCKHKNFDMVNLLAMLILYPAVMVQHNHSFEISDHLANPVFTQTFFLFLSTPQGNLSLFGQGKRIQTYTAEHFCDKSWIQTQYAKDRFVAFESW